MSTETYQTIKKKDAPTIAADDLQEYSENDSKEKDLEEKTPEDEEV